MTHLIYRYEVPVDRAWHELYLNGPTLHVACRRPGVVEFWALYNPTADLLARQYIVVGTGWELPDFGGGWTHVGSALDREFVWHLINRRDPQNKPFLNHEDIDRRGAVDFGAGRD